jgi:DNA (cytosine-5)-methyltransferase 1
MNYLSLFSGIGGGDLAYQHLLGWRCLGYVEWEIHCQRILAQRIKEGYLDEAPVFGDIRAFNREGFAVGYTGLVDCITGGFPCQPFSVAGKRKGGNDERNMWPATIDCVRRIRPRCCFFENVPNLLRSGYFGTILKDLAESGYDCRWRILSAAEVGAPHKRDRLWLVAHTHGTDVQAGHESAEPAQERRRRSRIGYQKTEGGKLNPRFVEWLMDMPDGWTSLEDLATPKFRQWQQQHGIS